MKFEELKQVYQSSKTFEIKGDNKNKDPLALKMADMTAYLDRISNLEKELNSVNSNMQLKDITLSSNEKSLSNLKETVARLEKEKEDQATKYEHKIKNKKDKIRGLQTEYSEKNRNCEHLKMQMEGLEQRLKEATDQARSRGDELRECMIKLKHT